MSEYKRFVSYMYEYHDHEKGTNRGFMKVECRNGFCLMNFALKGLCRDENGTVDIYGFRRKGSLLEGSLLETVPIQGGTLNYSLRFHDDQIGEGNYSMEELAGVIILCKEDFLYATQWDDEPMNFQGFPNHPLTSDVRLDYADTPSGESISEPSIPSEESISEPSTPSEENISEPSTPSEESISEPSTPSTKNTSKQDMFSDSDLSESDSSLEGTMPTPDSTPASSNAPAPDDTPSSAADIHATSTEPKDFSSQNRPYFRDGSIVNCVKITPKELGKLHPRDWHLTNNRFIHYGYQMFGHLLVGQLADSGQTVLCVPGSYHQRECFMANMFGFSQFIRCPGHKNQPQYFGYWYRSIQPTNLNKGNSPA